MTGDHTPQVGASQTGGHLRLDALWQRVRAGEWGELSRPLEWGPFGAGQNVERDEMLRCLKKALAPAISTGLLRIEREVHDSDHDVVVVAPAGKVGFTSTADREFLEVRPKVAEADYLSLMLLADGHKAMVWEHAAILNEESRPGSFIDLLVAGLIATVGELVRGVGLRRNHQRVQETLSARTRGRVLVGRYLTHLATGRLLDVPCSFERHDIDNLPNQALLWALRLSRAALESRLGGGTERVRRDALLGDLRELELIFDAFGVTCRHIRPEAMRGLERLPSGFDPYKPALAIARMLIRDVVPTIAGGGIESISLAVDMAKTFEKAFELFCRDRFCATPQPRWPLEIVTGGAQLQRGEQRPDVVIATANTVLVLDTKWKSVVDSAWTKSDARSNGQPGIQDAVLDPTCLNGRFAWSKTIQFNYADLHQMWSYLHVASETCPEKRVVGALIYPAATASTDEPPAPIEVRPLAASPSSHRRLYLVPWNVHVACFQDGLDAVERVLHDLLSASDVVELAVAMTRDEVEQLDNTWAALGFASRAEFLRRAITEYVGLRAVDG
jgi:5-methylcytosine-specific restriction endonuclease McrBC regulatory subunit McrC